MTLYLLCLLIGLSHRIPYTLSVIISPVHEHLSLTSDSEALIIHCLLLFSHAIGGGITLIRGLPVVISLLLISDQRLALFVHLLGKLLLCACSIHFIRFLILLLYFYLLFIPMSRPYIYFYLDFIFSFLFLANKNEME